MAVLKNGQDLRVGLHPQGISLVRRDVSRRKKRRTAADKERIPNAVLVPPRTTPSIGSHHSTRKRSSHPGMGKSPLASAVILQSDQTPTKEVRDRSSRTPCAGQQNTGTGPRALSFPSVSACRR